MALVLASIILPAKEDQDWASWRGPQGDGSWHGPGVMAFPETGLQQVWRTRVQPGYSGIAVAKGRVYTMDLTEKAGQKEERLLCLDSETGKILWTWSHPVDYKGLSYGKGPRSMPTVFRGRVYTLGAIGHLACHDALTGKRIWFRNTVKEWKAVQPTWGFSAAIRPWKERLVVPLGLKDGGTLVAIDPANGEKVWQGGMDGAGYGWPVPIRVGLQTQFLYWSPQNIIGLSPENGKLLWSYPYKVKYGVSIATPIYHEGIAYVAGYWNGSRALIPKPGQETPTLAWETETTLRGLMAQPLYKNGVAYLMDRHTGVNAFEFKTGNILWQAGHHYEPAARNPQATMVWTGNGNQVLILNSPGELILAEFSPKGHKEISREHIIGQTWAHPAYVGDSIFARSDREIVRVRLPVKQ